MEIEIVGSFSARCTYYIVWFEKGVSKIMHMIKQIIESLRRF